MAAGVRPVLVPSAGGGVGGGPVHHALGYGLVCEGSLAGNGVVVVVGGVGAVQEGDHAFTKRSVLYSLPSLDLYLAHCRV